MKLNVSEIFYSIQGEGKTMGVPSVFLRLGGCNLLCEGYGWKCDTIEVWRKSKATIFEEVIKEEWVERLKQGAHLVITGGEPLLQQQGICDYLSWFHDTYDFLPFIEIETNGTIAPTISLFVYADQFNCSPKLRNSGEDFNRRFIHEALQSISTHNGFWFKFVVTNEADVLEVLQDFDFLPHNRFIFMPAGSFQKELNIIRPVIADQCVKLGIHYCDRLQVTIWDKTTGV